MKAILIDSVNREVKEVDVTDYKSYYPLINCECFTVVNFGKDNDSIFVDDEGLLKDPENFFMFRGSNPLAGNGLILGTDSKGESIAPKITLEQVKEAVKFLDYMEVAIMNKLGFFQ